MAGRKHRHMENRILRDYFGTVRQLQETQSVGRSCDGYTPTLAIELGTHPIPQWLKKEMQQATDYSREKLPITVIHEKGTEYDDSVVCIRLRDYVDAHIKPLIQEGVEGSALEGNDNALTLHGFVLCTCGERLTTFDAVNKHRKEGHFARTN